MQFTNVVLESTALHLPDEVWTSDDIENQFKPTYDRLNLSVGRLEHMTGIAERRVWEPDFLPSREAAKAGEKALARSNIKPEDIGLLIHSGVCRDRLEPSTAAYVHKNLGLPANTQIMDISNACLGFLNAMIHAASMIQNGIIKAALVVTAENSRTLLENTIESLKALDINRKTLKPYFANLTIGSGAVAGILCHSDLTAEGASFESYSIHTNSAYNHLCEGGDVAAGHGYEMQTDSEKLLIAGIDVAKNAWNAFKKVTHWTNDSINHYICHQVGKMHQAALYEGLALNPLKDYSTYSYLGNMGSAALPGTLARASESGTFRSGEQVALLGIGSGVTSLMLAMRWI